MSAYRTTYKVRFQHCDPAGIVFYPRYFEMLNAVVEDWFEEGLELPWRELVLARGNGVPIVKVDAEFLAVSKLGDDLSFVLNVERVSRSSVDLRVEAICGTEERVLFRLTLVHFSVKAIKSVPWPEPVRQRISAYQANQAALLGE